MLAKKETRVPGPLSQLSMALHYDSALSCNYLVWPSASSGEKRVNEGVLGFLPSSFKAPAMSSNILRALPGTQIECWSDRNLQTPYPAAFSNQQVEL